MQSGSRTIAAFVLVLGLSVIPAGSRAQDSRLLGDPFAITSGNGDVQQRDNGDVQQRDNGDVQQRDNGDVQQRDNGDVQQRDNGDVQQRDNGDVQQRDGHLPVLTTRVTSGDGSTDIQIQQQQVTGERRRPTPRGVDPTVLNPDRRKPVAQVDQTVLPQTGQRSQDVDFGDLSLTGVPGAKGQNGMTDQSSGVLPPLVRHGPPGRGPKGDYKWETLDDSNQGGSQDARNALGKELFGLGVGFSPQDLRTASRGELVDILMWLDDTQKREEDYAANLDRTAKKLQRKKENLYEMSIGQLYKERVGGWFDHQKDADDMRVSMDFKRFLQDRANRADADPRGIYAGLLQDIDHLILIAAPAYGVSITPQEVQSVKTVESKFPNGDNNGVFQFAATYVMGLMLDRQSLKDAIQSKTYTQVPIGGKGKGTDIYSPVPPLPDPWGKGNGLPTDIDQRGLGKFSKNPGAPGDVTGGPRSPGGNDNYPGGIDPNTRALMRRAANAGEQIFAANDNANAQMAALNQQYANSQAIMNAQGQPQTNIRGIQQAMADSDNMLNQIDAQQRQAILLITQWRQQTNNPQAQQQIEGRIRALAYGTTPQQPAPGTILGMMSDPRLKNALGYASQASQVQNPALQSAYGRIFGAGGKLDRIQRTEHDVIAAFLRDRDANNGMMPNGNGQFAGQPGFNNPNGLNGQFPGSPTSSNQNGLPPGMQTPATDPNARIAQIQSALQDPNLTPTERANLQAEQQRLQQQVAQQQQAAAQQAAAQQRAALTAANPTQTAGVPLSPADAAARAKAMVPNVPNSYGIAPACLSDAQLQAAAQPVIQAHLAQMNKELSGKGITVNEYLQYSGKGVTSTGRPGGDRFKMWMEKFPDVAAAMSAAAQNAYNQQLQTATQQVQATPVAATVTPQPVSTPAQVGVGPASAIVEPR